MFAISQGSGKPAGSVLYLRRCVNCQKLVGEIVSTGNSDKIIYYDNCSKIRKFDTFPKIHHYQELRICNFCKKPIEYLPKVRKDGKGIQWRYNTRAYLQDIPVNNN